MKFSCLLNSYDSGNSLIGTNVTIGRDSTSRQYTPAQADTTYAMYVAISENGNFTGNNVVYEQKQEYALKFKGADYTFSNFVCANAEVSTKKNTVASVAKNTNVDYTKDYIVEDERDNKYYIVRKLYMRADDGTISTACWMTQNLDLDLVARYENSTQAAIYAYNRENNTINRLTENNSDLITDWTTKSNTDSNMLYAYDSYSNNRYLGWQTSYKFATLSSGANPIFPTTTLSNNQVTPSGASNPDDTPGMLDTGDIMFGPFDATRSVDYANNLGVTVCESGDTKCFQFRNTKYFATETSGHLVSDNAVGNYYNWYTATAGTGRFSVTDIVDVEGSICPKGWGLPTGYYTYSEFNQVMSAYFPTAGVTAQNGTVYRIGDNYTGWAELNTLRSNSDNMLTDTPLSFPRSHGTSFSAGSSSQGVAVNYWSATAHPTDAFRLRSLSGVLYSATYSDNRGDSTTVRCMYPAS